MELKKLIPAIVLWIVVYYGLLIGCILCGCLAHSVTGYAVLASVGVLAIAVIMAAITLTLGGDGDTVAVAVYSALIFVLCGGLGGGFLGFTWNNYCVFINEPLITSATASDVQDGSMYRFNFPPNVYLVTEYTQWYNNDDYYAYAAPVVSCPGNTTPADGSCPGANQVQVMFWAVVVKYYSGYTGNGGAGWSYDQREAARLSLLWTNYINSAVGMVKSSYNDRLLWDDSIPYLTWDSLDSLKHTWEANAIGTLVGVVLAPFVLPLLLAAVYAFS